VVTVERELAALLGPHGVLGGDTRAYLTDATETRRLVGHADAIALPNDAHQVASVMRWCYEHDVPLVPRGGGTGLAGGAVPTQGGVVLSLERLQTVRALEPELWRAHVEAGVTTATLHRRARESGLLYAPDPGASEQSQLGGNIATNAGGPHTFKYGVTGSWVTGLELVLAPGELVTVGGPIRKDVSGYDTKALMIGSEGTLGVVTAAWLKLIPAPELQLPVVATYADARAGCDALLGVLANGIVPAALEFLDEGALEAAKQDGAFMLIAEADGSTTEAHRVRAELTDVLADGAQTVHAPEDGAAIRELWRWRAGVSHAVAAQRGGKVSEDIVVPVERLREAIDATREIGARHGLDACSWGHAGDGNLHSTFMIDRDRPDELERAEQAAQDLFALARRLGGSVSGEHGLGVTKRGAAPASALDQSIKRLFDPKGLLNPGKRS
jgi:glycolate oxidase subunit GlcD